MAMGVTTSTVTYHIPPAILDTVAAGTITGAVVIQLSGLRFGRNLNAYTREPTAVQKRHTLPPSHNLNNIKVNQLN